LSMLKKETKMNKCLNCKFFGTDIVQGYETGVCRRYAPQRLSGVGADCCEQQFPIVRQDEFCGEFEEDPEHRFHKVPHPTIGE